MANLRSHVERWLSLESAPLIQQARQTNRNWSLAQRTVEAVTPSLMKMEEGYLSEDGNIRVFLYVALDAQTKKVLCSVAEQDEENELKPRLTVYDQEAQDLIAAFLCDFPDALFSVDGGQPIVMLIEVPAGSTSPGFVPGEKVKRFVTLNNMLEAVQNKWYKMIVMVPGGKKKSAATGSCGKQQMVQDSKTKHF